MTVVAAEAPAPRLTDGIVVSKAQDRLLELIEREQLPGDVRHTLAGALSGDLRRQQLLFQAMADTWPRLQKALAEVKRAVRKAPWQVQAWRERGRKPKPADEKLAREIEGPIWSMKPDVPRGEKLAKGQILSAGVTGAQENAWLRFGQIKEVVEKPAKTEDSKSPAEDGKTTENKPPADPK